MNLIDTVKKNINDINRYKIYEGPTEIEKHDGLKDALNLDCNLYIKREDQIKSFCGNKVRYIEYLLGEYYEGNYDCIIHGGGNTSNYMFQLAVICAELKIPLYLVILNREKYNPSLNLELIKLLGATLYIVDSTKRNGTNAADKDHLYEELISDGRSPYKIEYPFGNIAAYLGYSQTYLEILNQCHISRIAEKFSDIFICSRWHSYVGLKTLALLNDDPVNIHCIQPSHWHGSGLDLIEPDINKFICYKIQEFLHFLNQSVKVNADFIYEQYVGCSYGSANKDIWDLISKVASNSSVLLDPIYTAKAFSGMLNIVKSNKIKSNVLFIHTGGQLNLFSQLINKSEAFCCE